MKLPRGLPFVVLTLGLASLVVGCIGDEDPPPDPPGTVTTQLVFVAPSSPSIRFATGSTSEGPFDLTLDTSGNFRGTLAPMGLVSGLADITAVPSSGFVATLAAEVGHAYVVRSADGLGTHYRVVVEADVLDTGGAIIGKKIRWAPLSLLASMTITPSSPTVYRPPMPTNGDNCSLDQSLQLHVDSVTYTDGSVAGRITSSSLVWSSDGPSVLDVDFIDPRTGIVTVFGPMGVPGNVCPPTPIYDYHVSVHAEGNQPVASTVVHVRTR